MRSVQRIEVCCPFCGQKRDVKIVSDDGQDWEGHHRGKPSEEKIDDGCVCPLGQIMHTHPPLKMMCLNCKYFEGGTCSSTATVKEISQLFDVTSPVRVKDVTRRCKHWELNQEILAAPLSIQEELP